MEVEKKINVRLLRKVAKHITEEPKRFQMGTWYQSAQSRTVVHEFASEWSSTHKFPKCGTAACIGGWACILSGVKDQATLEDAGAKARKLLGLDRHQANRLFSVSDWPYRLRDRYLASKNVSTRVKLAISRIEHFIATKGAE